MEFGWLFSGMVLKYPSFTNAPVLEHHAGEVASLIRPQGIVRVVVSAQSLTQE
jgi:hypothetical protein